MTDKELIRIVTGFRNGILGRRSPLKMCFAICSPLSTYLSGCGVINEITEGEIKLGSHNKGITIGHFWLTLKDGRIVDPTSSQFNGMGYDDMPPVYLGVKPKYYATQSKKTKNTKGS